MSEFDIRRFERSGIPANQYEKQLRRLGDDKKQTDKIEETIKKAIYNLRGNDIQPFVIHGEPQSGKTEMMICLTAKLMDERYKFIVVLLNDSIDLLKQNLSRFQASGLAPSPKNFSEIIDPDFHIGETAHIVFCKKNPRDLQKLIDKIDSLKQVVVIDDEADYASPNAKINRDQKTKINELIEKLIGGRGVYVGVTATPARLDINKTFNNEATRWVNFEPHSAYIGYRDFFPPPGSSINYRLNLLPDKGDRPEFLRRALLSFLAASACRNLDIDEHRQTNYSMLIHTSGKMNDHEHDRRATEKILSELNSSSNKKYHARVKELWDIAKERFPSKDPSQITKFVIANISRNKIIVLNRKKDLSISGDDATNPKSLFTIIIGGNIVSRGVTLNNLLSMYFTRDAIKTQQDTYIQRARMFGSRGEYLKDFELSIPEYLYRDWHRCFAYHRFSLEAFKDGNPPIWTKDIRVNPVAIMRFPLFNLGDNVLEEAEKIAEYQKPIECLGELLKEEDWIENLIRFTRDFGGKEDNRIAIYPPSDISSQKPDPQRNDDIENVYRSRGFWGQFDRDKNKKAIHHLRLFHYRGIRAKLCYRYDGEDISRLTFMFRGR